ncbi:MAG: IS110 family transposase [Actinomycetota bacterium]
MGVVVGVDSHKESVAAAAVDELGRTLEVRRFANDSTGHDEVLAWVQSNPDVTRIGIEGSGVYGAALARALMAAGEDVREVPPTLTFRERCRNGSHGKSDPVDAVAIARVVVREGALSSPRRTAVWDDLKLLVDYRDQLVRVRTQFSHRIHRDLVVVHPGYQKHVSDLRSKKNVAQAAKLLRGDRSVRAELTRRRISQLRRLDQELTANKTEIASAVARSETRLTDLPGIGVLIAAKFVAETGDVTKIRSESAFAMLTGTAPLQASSGATSRHRLNRGGNRQLNHALHYMALVQYRSHPAAHAYIERKRAEGMSFKEAMRCLKRHLAKVVYRRMMADATRLQIAA